ncbi:MAG: aldehyde dehydrogenase family protein, partial [Cyclobacteriaceae bacterium]|nr:aldehyde dehydrogenase family protein [Cyclobacteriaceae bacterium]
LGKQLVLHPEVKSVAFTGSLRGGKALHELATQRETPIPVFAEMGSTNPVVILPGKLQAENDALAASYAGSITLGVGQFCTNPGLVLGIAGEPLEKFISSLGDEIAKIAPATMLNKGINTNYYQQLEKTLAVAGVKIAGSADKSDNKGSALVASVEGNIFLKNPSLHEEVFGPFSLVVKCADKEELKAVLIALSGQLTTTVMCNDADLNNFAEVIGAMEQVAGRLIFNGVPTGVEVCHSMQHGGPYPATTDGRFTSVGTDAILRFVRPLSFQSAPGAFLPDELKDSNPLGIWRKVNGIMTQ